MAGLWDELARLQGKDKVINGALSSANGGPASATNDSEDDLEDASEAADDTQIARPGFSLPVKRRAVKEHGGVQ